ncbi:FKBP-type peptidyl-prolyl cis-trans isomerase [Microbacterium azadirachtae]|uniref:peptidylprolyl isomerase n=1 Tax=Microbacterium azadirachtae TaxID=582680 RepID=A0A0F0KGZ3_9MICO|nr:FKBP-type peptidyl-prolyl cis-trans isomerase [Microbacterium azadirachtae]KJL19410.1 FK506-binding protein [Microbacterium azadirachtae]UXW84717.1 FKBP-type peptidyl-prolyl cis-trans isomerase [Microbacterium azadirachtae]SDL44516.1 peptidylprolyl isomerase [Microbacterium azadirachtae]SEF74819.1 peptidylprolyl isomerase [Microbacterium azadirachtae]SEF75658.1 peptidylprolyl isomerase [Microbacterium azadirachtae]
MRIRIAAALSAVAATALLLSGCAGAGSPSASPTPSASSSCLLDAKPGKASDAVTLEGEGKDLKVTVPSAADVDKATAVERTVVKKGDGKDVKPGDLVSVQYRIVNAADSAVLDSSSRGSDDQIPVLLDPQQQSLFVAALECQPLGSAVVAAIPGKMFGDGGKSVVVYAQATKKLSTVADGTAVAPVDGMPAVKLAKDGAPEITIPKADPPTETKISLLKQGDGATVASGDYVIVQYRGVTWADGKEFDSSWKRGTPAQFQTTGVVTGFKKALEGQKVGSQVLAVIPPADGYGAQAQGSIPANSTLVFVVDILGTVPAAPTQ